MFSILCQKNPISNLWCFDHVFSGNLEVKEEPLMHQATELIDLVLMESYGYIPKQISIFFDHNELFEPDVLLQYKEPSNNGSMYKSVRVLKRTEDYVHEVWLCSVLTYFYKKPPEHLYVLITEKNKDTDD
jgi:hypothetical protein